MKFATLTACFERLEATSSRNEMTTLLARLLAAASPDEIGTVCYFVLGEIGPGYSDVNLGIGDRTTAAAIALAAGTDPAPVEAAARELGDYGDVAVRLIAARPRGRSRSPTSTAASWRSPGHPARARSKRRRTPSRLFLSPPRPRSGATSRGLPRGRCGSASGR
jgi:DNA ligase N terminus.